MPSKLKKRRVITVSDDLWKPVLIIRQEFDLRDSAAMRILLRYILEEFELEKIKGLEL